MEVFRFVLQHLPGNIKTKEIEEMIKTVDKNRDGKISYSEFRARSHILIQEPNNDLYRSCWELFLS